MSPRYIIDILSVDFFTANSNKAKNDRKLIYINIANQYYIVI